MPKRGRSEDHPVETDARRPPKRPVAHAQARVVPRARNIDPRFDNLYGALNPHHVRERYAFLKELSAEENEKCLARLRDLRARRARLVAASRSESSTVPQSEPLPGQRDILNEVDPLIGINVAQRKGASPSPASDDDEAEGEPSESSDGERSVGAIEAEMEHLRRKISQFKQQSQMEKAEARTQTIRRDHMKREAAAVRSAEKARPYFLKPRELKKAVERTRFAELEQKGGQQLVQRFVEKKSKRRPRI